MSENTSQFVKEKITGLIQKGPFINGTEITMYELDSSLTQTGKTFSGQIKDNRGAFQLNNMELSSPFVEFSANGFYYDEVKGDISPSQLNLYALSDVRDISSVNVNVLTHLERRRVFYLLKKGMTFNEAKKKAQSEILNIFGFSANDMEQSENLDISIDNKSNAILLTIASILQGNQKVGELTELLASIAADMEADGVLDSQETYDILRSNALKLNPFLIQKNLTDRYTSIGIEASVPGIVEPLKKFLNLTATIPEIISINTGEIGTHEAFIDASILANNSVTEMTLRYGETEALEDSIKYTGEVITGSNTSNIEQQLKNLKPKRTYYYAVTAENAKGKVQSTIHTFMTKGDSPEILSNIYEADTTSFKVSGEVDCGQLKTVITLKYGKDGTYENEFNTTLKENTTFQFNIENLEPGNSYIYVLQAKNELDTISTEPKEIKTAGGAPKFFSIYSDDAKAKSIRFFIDAFTNDLASHITLKYKTSEWATETTTVLDTMIAAKQGHTSFQKEIAGLKMDQEYFFLANITNTLGSYEIKTDRIRTKDGKIVFEPVFIDGTYLYPRTNIPLYIMSDGGLPISSRGLVYAPSPSPAIGNAKVVEDTSDYSNVHYRIFLEELKGGIKYYVRGYATNETGIYYSDELNFMLRPSVETNEVKMTEDNKIMLVGSIKNGVQNLDRIGFCWITEPNVDPSVNGDQIEGSLNNSEFTQIIDLEPEHTYYIRAYAENPAGISYGKKMTIEL